MRPGITWPAGKAFAFTIFDDPDDQTLENGQPVYEFLGERGFRTTKAVWPLRGTERGSHAGATCEDPGYRAWAKELQRQGFEIALHNVTYHTSARAETIRGLERFAALFGDYPRTLANHTGCRESIYWGPSRLTGANRALYGILVAHKQRRFEGHLVNSPLFWGDICQQRIKYVRNFVFDNVNTLAACPGMPYHDRDRPYVNYWFAGAEGAEVGTFTATLSEANQDRLAAEGGACIIYTHLAAGFCDDSGRLHPRFRALMDRLSRLNGWFVPVSTLLDHLQEIRGPHEISDRERRRLERRWLWQKLRRGTS
jgi:hypothetical protein